MTRLLIVIATALIIYMAATSATARHATKHRRLHPGPQLESQHQVALKPAIWRGITLQIPRSWTQAESTQTQAAWVNRRHSEAVTIGAARRGPQTLMVTLRRVADQLAATSAHVDPVTLRQPHANVRGLVGIVSWAVQTRDGATIWATQCWRRSGPIDIIVTRTSRNHAISVGDPSLMPALPDEIRDSAYARG